MFKRILVPIDGSATSDRGLREAVKLATHDKARIRLVHVVNELVGSITPDATYAIADYIPMLKEGGRKILAKAVARIEKQGLKVETAMIENFGGIAADLIVKESKKWKADIIVLGTHGRRGLKRVLMGSDAEQILRLATVPVLMVRSRNTAPRKTARKSAATKKR